VEKVPVGEESPVLGREQASGVVHGIETVGADFKGVRGGQGVGLNPAHCPNDSGHFSCIVGWGRRSEKVGFRGVRYDWAILIRVRFRLVG